MQVRTIDFPGALWVTEFELPERQVPADVAVHLALLAVGTPPVTEVAEARSRIAALVIDVAADMRAVGVAGIAGERPLDGGEGSADTRRFPAWQRHACRRTTNRRRSRRRGRRAAAAGPPHVRPVRSARSTRACWCRAPAPWHRADRSRRCSWAAARAPALSPSMRRPSAAMWLRSRAGRAEQARGRGRWRPAPRRHARRFAARGRDRHAPGRTLRRRDAPAETPVRRLRWLTATDRRRRHRRRAPRPTRGQCVVMSVSEHGTTPKSQTYATPAAQHRAHLRASRNSRCWRVRPVANRLF